MYYIAILFLP